MFGFPNVNIWIGVISLKKYLNTEEILSTQPYLPKGFYWYYVLESIGEKLGDEALDHKMPI